MGERLTPHTIAFEKQQKRRLRQGRRELDPYRNGLIIDTYVLFNVSSKRDRRAWLKRTREVNQDIEDVVLEKILPSKEALDLPIENVEAEKTVVRKAKQFAKRALINPDFAEIVVQGSIERTKIAQGVYDGDRASWKRPQSQKPAA